jgi:hypothetical protein
MGARAFGVFAAVVGVLLLGLLWIAQHRGGEAPAPQASEFCNHVSSFEGSLLQSRDSGTAPSSSQLLAAQSQFQADAIELARTGQSIGAASATRLATDVAQWRKAVVAGDAAEENMALNRTLAGVASVPGC